MRKLNYNFVENRSVTECVEWDGLRAKNGYGRLRHGKKMVLAHRLAYCKAHDIDLESIFGFVVKHSCDNRPCVNPAHLSLGTQAQNLREMAIRKRSALGSRNGRSKLTADQVAEIRTKYAAGGVTQRELASRYLVAQSAISLIFNNIRWHSL